MEKIIVNQQNVKEICEGIETALGFGAGELKLAEILHAYEMLNFIKSAMLKLPNGQLAWEIHVTSIKIPIFNVSKMETADLLIHMFRGGVGGMIEEHFNHEVIDGEELLAYYRAYRMWEDLPSILLFIEKTKAVAVASIFEYFIRLKKTPEEVPLKVLLLSSDVRNEFKLHDTPLVNDLTKLLMGLTKGLFLPLECKTSEHNHEKKSELSLLLSEKFDELNKYSPKQQYEDAATGKWNYILNAIKRDFQDFIKAQRTQKWMPTGGFQSLNEEVEGTHESRVSMLEILTTKYDSLQTPPPEIEEEFTSEQRQQLKQLLGKTGLKIFEYRHRHQEIGQWGENKIIAQTLGIAESTVGRYIGTQKRIGIIEVNANKIRAILS